ncbi:hypothetical protein MLD38_034896 [Melastoma candidum]|uniref:Uncharacterized protein n=1 Tax=Melastoma candidum TaxID=119954 RepID=A0ACB9MC22_9MYRT|nr:hypothetical protein MLD38_034896 [Melastoma candidum]
MIIGEHQETFYDVLSVKESASYEEIRAQYKSLILDLHPDKLQASESGGADQSLGNRFLNVQRAWEVLSNAESRRHYDNELRASKDDLLVAEDVGLDDMMVEDSGEVLQFLYHCRCGDTFCIDSQEFEEMGYTLLRNSNEISIRMSDASSATVIIPCGSCSLRVRLLVNPDSKIYTDDYH